MTMEIGEKRLKMELKYKRSCCHKSVYNLNIYNIILLILVVLLLCSCQRETKIIVYMGPDSNQDMIEELEVQDGKYQEALERCKERLKQVPEDSVEAAEVYRIMGGTYATYMEDRENAMKYINKAIEIDQKENNERGLAQDYNQMANIYIYIGGVAEEGIEYLRKAEDIYEKLGMANTLPMAETLINIGMIYDNEGNYEKSLENYEKAWDIYKINREESDMFYIYKGIVYVHMQEYEKAEEQFLIAKKCFENKNDKYETAEINIQLGIVYGEMNEYNLAIDYYRQALNFYITDNSYLSHVAYVYNGIGYYYWNSRQVEKAIEESVNACRTIESIRPTTNKTEESKRNYKYNLKMDYKKYYPDMSDGDFEKWYQETVIEGKDYQKTVTEGRD